MAEQIALYILLSIPAVATIGVVGMFVGLIVTGFKHVRPSTDN
jgi:hypothetical protein